MRLKKIRNTALKRILVAFALTVFFLCVQAQSKTAQLKQQVERAKDDTALARALNELAWEIRFTDPLNAATYAGRSVNLFMKTGNTEGVSKAFRTRAFALIVANRKLPSVLAYDSAILFARKAQNLSLEASCLNYKGGMFGDFGDFDKAIEFYSTGLEIALKIKDNSLIATFYNNLADAYQNIGGQTQRVQKYYNLALEHSLKAEKWSSAALNAANLAAELADQKRTGEAEKELEKVFALLKKTLYGTYAYAAANNQVAHVYEVSGNSLQARKYALMSYRIFDSLKMVNNLLQPLLILTNIEIKAGNFIKAEEYGNLLLTKATEKKAKIYLKDAYKSLSNIARQKGDAAVALGLYEKYKSWSDSVFQMEREKNMAQMSFRSELAKYNLQVRYELMLKDNENKKLTAYNDYLKAGIIAGFLVFFVFAALVLMLYRSDRKMKLLNTELRQKNILVEKQATEKDVLLHEIHHRVKNNLTMLQSLFYLQSKSAKHEEVRQVLTESQTRLMSMALVHQHLYENENQAGLDMVLFINHLFQDIGETFKSTDKEIVFKAKGVKAEIDIKQAIPAGLILNELITNSLKYAFLNSNSGKIEAEVSETGGYLQVDYRDNGPGLDKEFDLNDSGFGFKIVKLLCRQLKAEITYHKDNNNSKFTLKIPKS